MKLIEDDGRRHLLGLPKNVPEIGQEADAKARLSIGGSRYERYGRYAGAFGPMLARRLSNGEQCFPDVCITVFNAVGHCWPRLSHFLDYANRPSSKLVAKPVSLFGIDTPPKWRDVFIWTATAHAHDD